MNTPVLTYTFTPAKPDSFAELDEVRLTSALRTCRGETVPAGSEGTVLAVWAGGAAYEVEFDAGVATVEAELLTRA